jgi:hypothetical protein
MPESRYEKYIVRKPGILKRVSKDEYIDEVPVTDKIPNMSPINTGPRIIYSNDLIKSAHTKVEYGFIMGDTVVGDSQDFDPHKHDYEEIFLFLGTDTNNTADLGAEVEFWLGEGKDLEKVVFTTSSSVYVPPGVAHFPQFFRNVKRPVMTVVIMPTTGERILKPVELKNRLNF